jgi:hypothetical protein
LAVLQKGEISWERVYRIIDRGLDLCFQHEVTPYIGLKPLVDYLGIDWGDYWEPDVYAKWSDWRLVIDGVEYEGFKTIEDWAEHYGAEITEEERFKWSAW